MSCQDDPACDPTSVRRGNGCLCASVRTSPPQPRAMQVPRPVLPTLPILPGALVTESARDWEKWVSLFCAARIQRAAVVSGWQRLPVDLAMIMCVFAAHRVQRYADGWSAPFTRDQARTRGDRNLVGDVVGEHTSQFANGQLSLPAGVRESSGVDVALLGPQSTSVRESTCAH